MRATTLNLIKPYLSDRKQRVKIENILSDYDDIKYGVPEGTVPGSILFLIYINDIKITTENSLTSYALVRIIG